MLFLILGARRSYPKDVVGVRRGDGVIHAEGVGGVGQGGGQGGGVRTVHISSVIKKKPGETVKG
jgi:hypothetical protein